LPYAIPLVSFILGLVIGSFLNVCICRLPYGGSIVSPGSACPNCGRPLAPRDLVPVASYVALGGKCRYCGEPISIQYPIVELATGLLYAAIVWTYGLTFESLSLLIFVSLIIICAGTDFNTGLILNSVTFPGVAIGVAMSFVVPSMTPLESLLGLLVSGGVVWIMYAATRGRGMGGGDVKFMAMVGAFLGWDRGLLTLFLGALIGSMVGIARIVSGKQERRDPIPFGPFLSIGAIISVFFGAKMLGFLHLW
jgi:leader peptidase (prepilin peptidase)/N-methyltransferase